ncbi:MAG: lipid-A-disaccharide synthase [Gammaproteobacteria bacterium]|nr:lipid-A-disaccharide synthase [Gammaproteobacteria bacterium]
MPNPEAAPYLMLVSGEASGDRYAAELVEELRARHPEWTWSGMGGEASREAGIELVVDSTELAVVGLVEVLRHYREIRGALKTLKAQVLTRKPQLLVLIDYPEFNLRLARFAHRHGVPVLFYISPQIWAWRAWRVHEIRRHVDHMAVVFPFERDFYEKHRVPVTYVGHPLRGQTSPTRPPDTVRERWGLDAQRPVIGLFPGSRRSELAHLMPVCAGAVRELRNHPARPQFALVMPPGLKPNDYAPWLGDLPEVKCLQEPVYDAMQVCDMAAAASGTVTLQLALMRVPFCMIYRLANLSYLLARLLVRIDRYCLANIVAGEDLVTELIQADATPQRVTAALTPWLDDPAQLDQVRVQLQKVEERLGPAAGMRQLANCAEQVISTSG